MLNKSISYDPTRYPIVIQVFNDQVIASQPDLEITRVRGKFSEIRKKEEIGAIVIDMIEEAMVKLRSIDHAQVKPSLAKEATASLRGNEKRTPRFMTPPYAARMMGVSKDTVSRMCDRGELDYKKTPGGHRRILVNQKNLRVLDYAGVAA